MKGRGKLSAKGAKIVGALEQFRHALADGNPLEARYTVQRLATARPAASLPTPVKATGGRKKVESR